MGQIVWRIECLQPANVAASPSATFQPVCTLNASECSATHPHVHWSEKTPPTPFWCRTKLTLTRFSSNNMSFCRSANREKGLSPFSEPLFTFFLWKMCLLVSELANYWSCMKWNIIYLSKGRKTTFLLKENPFYMLLPQNKVRQNALHSAYWKDVI